MCEKMDAEQRLAQSIGVPLTIEKIKIGEFLINYMVAGAGHPVLLIHGGNIGWGMKHRIELSPLFSFAFVYTLQHGV